MFHNRSPDSREELAASQRQDLLIQGEIGTHQNDLGLVVVVGIPVLEVQARMLAGFVRGGIQRYVGFTVR